MAGGLNRDMRKSPFYGFASVHDRGRLCWMQHNEWRMSLYSNMFARVRERGVLVLLQVPAISCLP